MLESLTVVVVIHATAVNKPVFAFSCTFLDCKYIINPIKCRTLFIVVFSVISVWNHYKMYDLFTLPCWGRLVAHLYSVHTTHIELLFHKYWFIIIQNHSLYTNTWVRSTSRHRIVTIVIFLLYHSSRSWSI